jgi:hypothetical protein
MCFAFGDSHEPAWAFHYDVYEDIRDKDVTPLPWRYIRKAKCSITNEFCIIYIEDVLHRAVG